jgi:glycosyl transferase family 87
MLAYFVYALAAGTWGALIRADRQGAFAPSRGWRRPALRIAVMSMLVAVTVYAMLALTRGRVFRDFDKAYYRAGTAVLADPQALYECSDDILCFVNIPIVAWLFTPVSLLPLKDAHAALGAASAASVLVLILLVANFAAAMRRSAGLGDAPGWLLTASCALVLLNGPLFYSIRLGNTTHFVALLVMALFAIDRDRRPALAGILAALAALMKPPLLLFGAYFALRRRTRAFAAWALTLGAIVAASVAVFGPDLHRQWLTQVVIASGGGPIAAYNSQSIASALARLLLPKGHLWTWVPLDAGPWFRAVQGVVSAAYVALVALACAGRRGTVDRRSEMLELFLVTGVALAVAPVTWTHYYVLLIPVLAWLAVADPPASPAVRALSIAAAVAASAPVVLFIPTRPDSLAALTERVLISHYLGGLAALTLLVMERRWRSSRAAAPSDQLAASA